MSIANSQLKPLEMSPASHAPRTHLLPTDLSGILTHGRHTTRAKSPLIHPDRPGVPGRPNTPHDEQLIDQTRKWVAQSFFGTLLKQMRNSPFKSPMFEGGRGGEAFGEMYDQRLVDHMSRGTGNKLVGAIVRSIVSANDRASAKAAYARQSRVGAAGTAQHTGAKSEQGSGGSASGQFGQKRATTLPSKQNVQPVRAHVTPGL